MRQPTTWKGKGCHEANWPHHSEPLGMLHTQRTDLSTSCTWMSSQMPMISQWSKNECHISFPGSTSQFCSLEIPDTWAPSLYCNTWHTWGHVPRFKSSQKIVWTCSTYGLWLNNLNIYSYYMLITSCNRRSQIILFLKAMLTSGVLETFFWRLLTEDISILLY